MVPTAKLLQTEISQPISGDSYDTIYYAPRPAEGRAPPKAVNGGGRAGGIEFFLPIHDLHI